MKFDFSQFTFEKLAGRLTNVVLLGFFTLVLSLPLVTAGPAFTACHAAMKDVIVNDNDKLVLNFNAECRRLLEGFVINNINDSTYYGKTNILVYSCKPDANWRNEEKLKSNRISIIDNSVLIDELKLNSFINTMFKKIPSMNATLSKIDSWTSWKGKVTKIKVSLQKNVKFIMLDETDMIDSYFILDKILSSFGIVNKDDLKYNIIKDVNSCFSHECKVEDRLLEKVRSELIEKGVI